MSAAKHTGVSAVLFALCLFQSPAVYANQKTLTDRDLLAMAANKYASGELPLSDNRYVTEAPKKGYIYLCHLMQENGGGAGLGGNWLHGNSWNSNAKLSVLGHITWNEAQFTNTVTDNARVLEGNGLPINHTTGVFPVQSSDPAYAYDRNPNSIRAQTVKDTLPLNPLYSDEPSCMGGESGVMLSGVPIFNGFDAKMRDAAAHEVQDECQGHPQQAGQYHYHSLSSCMKDIGEKTVLGYALDGFPITGPLVAPGLYLTTENLDECHGITSEIIEDGQKRVTYHYVMTQDFPYSVSCFRGKPIHTGPANRQNNMQKSQGAVPQQQQMPQQQLPPPPMQQMQQHQQPQGQMPPPPPQPMQGNVVPSRQVPAEAISACASRSDGFACGFTSPRGDRITGTCRTPLGLSWTVCMPAHPSQ